MAQDKRRTEKICPVGTWVESPSSLSTSLNLRRSKKASVVKERFGGLRELRRMKVEGVEKRVEIWRAVCGVRHEA